MEEAPWLDLLDDVTEKILERLPLPDYVRFAAVCRHWLSIQRHHRLRHHPSPPPMRLLPWFIIFDPQVDQEAVVACISPWESNSHLLELPDSARGKIFANSSPHGWLLMLDLDSSSSSSFCFSLMNPISKAIISLPAVDLPSFSFPPLISPPPRPVVFIMSNERLLFMLKLDGDRAWSQLQLPKLASSAVARRCGLYCVSPELELFVVDPEGPTVQVLDMDRGELEGLQHQRSILVESDEEEVLLVVYVLDGYGGVIKGFRVFRADVSGRKWVELGSIAGRVVVIEGGCGVSLVAEGSRGVRGNCIYFFQHSPERGGVSQWRAFDLGRRVVSDVDNFTRFTHRMFVPSLC